MTKYTQKLGYVVSFLIAGGALFGCAVESVSAQEPGEHSADAGLLFVDDTPTEYCGSILFPMYPEFRDEKIAQILLEESPLRLEWSWAMGAHTIDDAVPDDWMFDSVERIENVLKHDALEAERNHGSGDLQLRIVGDAIAIDAAVSEGGERLYIVRVQVNLLGDQLTRLRFDEIDVPFTVKLWDYECVSTVPEGDVLRYWAEKSVRVAEEFVKSVVEGAQKAGN